MVSYEIGSIKESYRLGDQLCFCGESYVVASGEGNLRKGGSSLSIFFDKRGRKAKIDIGTNDFIIECFNGVTNISKILTNKYKNLLKTILFLVNVNKKIYII